MPSLEDEELNKVDLYASRVFTLAVKFFGARRAIPSSDIRSELYPGVDDASFRRQYLRDRNLLASLGISINEVEGSEPDTLWQIDEQASYVQGAKISAEDARTLYVLCHDMAFDQAFPYRDELRVALVKIADIYRGNIISQEGPTPPYERKVLGVLVSALTNHEAVEVRYVDAKGNKSKRTLALLGSFGLREHTYFVASRIGRDATLVPDSVRTYRLDRVTHASIVQPPISYEIPQDFSVHDFERLPFQIGPALGVARLDRGSNPSREVVRASNTSGTLDENGVWEVPYSSTKALASWCVGAGVTPLGPNELIDAYNGTAAMAAHEDSYDPRLASFGTSTRRTADSKRNSGPDAITKVRQLITLAGALNQQGEVTTAQQVADALGVDFEQARHLIMLMSMGSGESYDYLPVVIDDDYDEVFLVEGAQLRVPRVRLTRSETLALRAALTELGVPSDDPLAVTLATTYASPTFTTDDIARSLEIPSSDSEISELRICSQAIADGNSLSFSYTPVAGGPTSQRRVMPLQVRRSDDSWYLDAYDLLREDMRVFRFDRMGSILVCNPPEQGVPAVVQRHEQLVIVRFNDPFYLDLFHWEGLEVLRRRGSSTICRLPYYGGSWLVRHLVACAGCVQISDEDLAAQVLDMARSLAEAQGTPTH